MTANRLIVKRQVQLLRRAKNNLLRVAAAMNEVAALEAKIDQWSSPYYSDAVNIAGKAEQLAERIQNF